MTNQAWAHRILLERYKAGGMKSNSTGRWSELRDDGYIHAHLCWHMEKAGESDQIVALLKEETIDGRNAWYEVREGLAQTGGYVTDLLRAWELTRERSRGYVERGEPIVTLALELRFVLLLTSINSLAASIPAELMGLLVRYGIWKPEVALDHCRRIPDRRQRAEALQAICHALFKAGRGEAGYGVLQEIDPCFRAEALPEIASCLTAPQLDGALVMIREAREQQAAIDGALRGIAPYLAEGQLQQALSLIADLDDALMRISLRMAIVPYLAEEAQRAALLNEALATAQTMQEFQIHAFADIIPHLPTTELRERVVSQTLACMQDLSTANANQYMLGVLTRLAPNLTPGEVEQVTHFVRAKALALIEKIKSPRPRIYAWISLWPYLKLPEERRKASSDLLADYAQIRQSATASERIQILLSIASVLIDEDGTDAGEHDRLLAEALALAHDTENIDERSVMQLHIATHLAKLDRVDPALSVALEIDDRQMRAYACIEIAPRISLPAVRTSLLLEALTNIRQINDCQVCAEVLIASASAQEDREAGVRQLLEAHAIIQKLKRYFVEHQLLGRLTVALAEIGQTDLALDCLREIGHNRFGVEALSGMTPYLSSASLQQVISYAREIESPEKRIAALIAIVSALPSEASSRADLLTIVLPEALRAAQPVKNAAERVRLFTNLLPLIARSDRSSVVVEAFALVPTIPNRNLRAGRLRDIAPYLSGEQLQQAIAIARAISTGQAKIIGLSGIALHLPTEERLEIVRECLTLLNTHDWRGLLGYLAPLLSMEMWESVLVSLRERGDWSYVQALGTVAPYLTGQMLQRTLTIVQEIEAKDGASEDAPYTANGLAAIAHQLAVTGHFEQALAVARGIRIGFNRAEALTRLVAVVQAGEIRAQLLQEALAAAEEADDTQINTILIEIVRQMHGLTPAQFYPLWERLLRITALLSRQEALKIVMELIPTLSNYGDEQTVATTIQAVQDVVRWWP